MIRGKALTLSIDAGAAIPTVTVQVDGEPTPRVVPFVATPGIFSLGGVTWNGGRISALGFGDNWTAEGAAVTVTLNPDANGVSQQTDFRS